MSTSDTAVTNSAEAMPLGGDAFAIETFALTRRYGDLIAADHVSLHVPYGSIFGLLGPNGAGKTTTIKMLTTMLEPSEGTASVAGFDIVKAPAKVRRSIGYVPQALSADGGLTAKASTRTDFQGLSALMVDLTTYPVGISGVFPAATS